ncbi:hypothetical protein NQ315_015938 [Exocentrus adspersus]|uniref:p53 DNA-binding domain-containing protein n=1 Tax=Exocentrus adspersus TaxID=1586481 RepID=A0AAV8VBP7_9CUCU|nr:hypothetical protein NQ315_015938 [Exocentrus adspersus]
MKYMKILTMSKGQTEIMSFPSDILSQEEQAEIFRDLSDIGDVNAMVNIFNENTASINDESGYTDEKDFKEESLFMSTPEHVMSPVISNILSNEEYPGPFEFEVDICPNGSKNPWVYSATLNKVFMDINSPFPVDFKIKKRPQNLLYIRITPVYSLPQHSQEFVYRCINHEKSPMEKSNRDTHSVSTFSEYRM